MTARTFVCRCEDVTLVEIDHAVDAGLQTIEELKRYTGLGTGPCQGKECLVTLASILAKRGGARPRAFTSRPPLIPVTFGALGAVDDGVCIARQRVVAQDHAERHAMGDEGEQE